MSVGQSSGRKEEEEEFVRLGKVFLACAVLVLLSVAAACGGGGGGGGGESLEGQTITYWASNQGATIDEDKEVIGRAVDEFKKETGITVEFKVIPWSDLYNNILTATTSGEGPDVLNIGNTWSASLQATGAFVPFEGGDLEAIGGREKFVETSWAASGAEGKTPTSVPLYGLSYGLFYNKAMFEEAGIQGPPETWDEFVEDAKKLTRDTDGDGRPDQWGVAVEGASITENAHFAFILGRQQGGRLFDEAGNPTFDTPENVRAVKQYIDFMGEDGIAAPSNAEYSTGTQSVADFANGKAAMLIVQNNAENTIKSNGMKQDEYGVAKVPLPDPMPAGGEPIMSHVAGINVSVFNNTDNKEAALEFVRFLTSKEQQVELNEEFGSLPITKEAQRDPAFSSGNLKTFNEILANNAAPMPLIPEEGQMETVVGDALKGLFAKAATGGAVSEDDVRAALKEANEKMASGGGS